MALILIFIDNIEFSNVFKPFSYFFHRNMHQKRSDFNRAKDLFKKISKNVYVVVDKSKRRSKCDFVKTDDN